VVALLLYRQHARYAGRAFTFANGEAAYFGIDRHTEYAALTNLEQGGLIKLGRRNGQALEITVLCDWRTGLP
jgi:hypothetical protein